MRHLKIYSIFSEGNLIDQFTILAIKVKKKKKKNGSCS